MYTVLCTTYPEQGNSYRNVINCKYKCKKLWFIHELTAHDTSKTAKITKRCYYSTAHWHLGDVLLGNHLFVIFAVLDVSCAVNSCINHSFFTFISYKPNHRIAWNNGGFRTLIWGQAEGGWVYGGGAPYRRKSLEGGVCPLPYNVLNFYSRNGVFLWILRAVLQ